MIEAVLITADNWDEVSPELLEKISDARLIGFDIETYDQPHDGIRKFRGSDSARIFDINRTIVAGFSIYVDGDDRAYYVSLAHKATSNTPWEQARVLLDSRHPDGWLVSHNAPFELVMMKKALNYDLGPNIICTLQLAVSAYSPDEYNWDTFKKGTFGEIKKFLPEANVKFNDYDPKKGMNEEQSELFAKVVSKESKSAHSYNGFVKDVSYGYGLKKAVKSFFGYQMQTFSETLGGREHMGEVPAAQVVNYGADDSFWAVCLFYKLVEYINQTNPDVLQTYMQQERPMVHVFADLWAEGLRVNFEGVSNRKETEQANYASILRDLRHAVRQHLPFPTEPHERMQAHESWYAKNYLKYRDRVIQWANLDNSDNDVEEIIRVSGAVASTLVDSKKKLTGPNFQHYMVTRTVMYDLLQEKPIYDKGKVSSDGEARGKMLLRRPKDPVIEALNKLSGTEQRMKLYLTPYSLITDPETGRMYPTISSQLATRRMASSNPNTMQLAKQGDSTYVRGFYLPDNDDHLIVSLDWRQIELVLIGELSGDPEFTRAYGQLPYKDLHLVAAASILAAMYETELTDEQFKSLAGMADDVVEPFGFPLVNSHGEALTPKEAYKYNRGTAGGKGANFGYWYSGSLNSVATARGVNQEKMWQMTQAYRERFSVAEQWRVDRIDELCRTGFLTLPDGHRRVRKEATLEWAMYADQVLGGSRYSADEWELNNENSQFRQLVEDYGFDQAVMMKDRIEKTGGLYDGRRNFARAVVRSIQTRAKNQGINALIQGTCATLAKRSILRIRDRIQQDGYNASFKIPIHDELVFSVHHKEIVPFVRMAKEVMTDHPDIIKSLKMDTTAAVGFTFEPYHAEKAPFGQIELDELPKGLLDLPPDGKATDNQMEQIVSYLREEHRKAVGGELRGSDKETRQEGLSAEAA